MDGPDFESLTLMNGETLAVDGPCRIVANRRVEIKVFVKPGTIITREKQIPPTAVDEEDIPRV